MPKLTNEQYAEMVRSGTRPSRTWVDMLRAFACGGAVCALGEALLAAWEAAGAAEDAQLAASLTLIFISAALTGLGVYDRFAAVALAGALVPITGFANAVAAPALEFKTEGMVAGMAAKMFVIAGPVLVYGTLAGMAYGLLLCLAGAG